MDRFDLTRRVAAQDAGVEHRFDDFRKDFATWVLFYGPEGGERAAR